jgi:signal peptidase II
VPARSDTVALVGIATTVAVIDQLTKFFIVSAIGPGRLESRVEVVDGWLALEYTQNRGAAFGVLPGPVPVLAAASLAILTGLLILYMRQARPRLWQTVTIGVISGGALGNLVDRVRLGYVVDFLSVGPWPNFNVADSAITVGVLVLIWGLTRPPTVLGMARAIDQGS